MRGLRTFATSFVTNNIRGQRHEMEEPFMRNRQIRSALDGVVLILSAILFSFLCFVSCKSEVKPNAAPLPPPPLARNRPPSSQVAPAEIDEIKVAQGVEGGVVGGVVGGIA